MPGSHLYWNSPDMEAIDQQRRISYEYMRRAMNPSNLDNLEIAYRTYGTLSSSDNSESKKNAVGVAVLKKIKAVAYPFTGNEKHAEDSLTEADKYRNLGLTAIAETLERKANKSLKELAISLAGYKRINRSELDKFQQELREVSDYHSKRELAETPLERYIGQHHVEGDTVEEAKLAVPPADILEKLKVAKDSKLFDEFSVLHIKYVPDPILCGKIKESKDLYFIGEWGDDVKLTDIVKE